MNNIPYFLYSIILYPIIFILPAYAANGAPVIFGGGKPIDFNKRFRKKRIFGDHKTIRGTLSSFIAGLLTGLIEFHFFHYMLLVSVFMVIGVNFGDLFGSFIKRQLNFNSGKSFPFLDQYGFFAFALLFVYAFAYSHFPDLYGMVFLIILTGLLHLSTNIGAYKLKLKHVPW
ncbi:MAG: CDP-2,3-bis-(O-geranylgeranyl)-sn-glycerol synthase [Candidatus Marsarchaeota archaeon]|nr:CDP-2,3-bis-(O-geranylgeranyl)-sn-glycerol synthase [Candidatus Marsarchaeota archaeon]MCL5094422.1 CDP-2,3-bis-(O-geranylgeranyl)-sn-glycerol synthase [Candidatus Marsarchaeota archaeon]